MDSGSPQQGGNGGGSPPVIEQVAEMQERLSRMESLIQQAASLALQQAQRADEIQADFEAKVAALESQLPKRAGEVDKADAPATGQNSELSDRIQRLEGELREKGELLESQGAELAELRSKLEQASGLAATQAEQTMEMQQGLESAVATLKEQLAEKEELLTQKEIAMKEMEESLTGLEESLLNQIRTLEEQVAAIVEKSAPETAELAESQEALRISPDKAEEA